VKKESVAVASKVHWYVHVNTYNKNKLEQAGVCLKVMEDYFS